MIVMAAPRFPTALHQQVAELALDFFRTRPLTDTVLVVNSCARGQAVPESDLDMAALLNPAATLQQVHQLEAEWQTFAVAQPIVDEFGRGGRFSQLHLDVVDGKFAPTVWDDGGGPDAFEIEIGNRIAYAAPLAEPGPDFRQLQSRWLPFYAEELRLSRLAMARESCARDLDGVPYLLTRGLHFSALDYLYKALQQFLQALFLARRAYPLSYTKWIREQVENRLALPELYRELPPLLSVRNLESDELYDKAAALHRLLDQWVPN
jgi:predicted nucleotidyltransferase